MTVSLRDRILREVLPRVRTPGQYVGGERNSVVKDWNNVKTSIALAFPDTYTLGMSHHGMQVLYSLANAEPDLLCERAYCPYPDFESELRRLGLPLYSLESFTPLCQFDIVGFSLQYEVCYTNILTMLDLGKIPLRAEDRGPGDPLVIAGGPGAQNPELLAPFIDVFVIGDGEETLLRLAHDWARLGDAGLSRSERIAQLVSGVDWAYAPRFYAPRYQPDGILDGYEWLHPNVPREVRAAVITQDFDAIPVPTRPVIPMVECAHDRIAIEIMRGCPWQCRFCQSTVIKRPLRVRSVQTIVDAALEAYRNTGYDEISILSLSSSDYPDFEELVGALSRAFEGKGVSVSVPSLRVNEQFRSLPKLMPGIRKGGLTLAPEVARDDMREQIRKPIDNQDLFEGCKEAFRQGWRRVKLYFMCGLPGERAVDLDGIVDLSETISRIGKDVTGRFVDVTASVSNFVPKPHTPYQWNGMQTREYFEWAHHYLRRRVRLRSVKVKCHDIDRSLLEGVLTRGDRRVADVLETAWRRGARLDAWDEYFDSRLWWDTMNDLGIDSTFYSQRNRNANEVLPWDLIEVKKGRSYLEKEFDRSLVQLGAMAGAV